MPLLCCDCNRQTKSKLVDENKRNFYIYLSSLFDEKLKNKETAYFIHFIMFL